MRYNRRWTIVATGLLALTAGAWLVWAGPVLPGTQRLPAEVEAMGGLKRFRGGEKGSGVFDVDFRGGSG